jgi:hypothetical protein
MSQNQRKVLYEAIRKGQERIASGIKSGQFSSGKKETPKFADGGNETRGLKDEVLSAGKKTEFSLLTGTLVISIPYRVAGVIVLALILVVLMAFWLGQIRGTRRSAELEPVETSEPAVTGQDKGSVAATIKEMDESGTVLEEAEADKGLYSPAGDNVIVIATVKDAEDLKPVQEYFTANGVGTKILQRELYCFLVTTDRFQTPNRRGSNGYKALQLIKKIGLDYNVPDGGKNFGKEPFQDAYPMKLR